MSAQYDKSQGITFVYSNIFELYKKAKESKIDSPFVVGESRVLKNGKAKAEAFQPTELKSPENQRPFAVPMGVREAEEKSMRQNTRSVASLQKSLSEISDAQSKLRFLLQELEALTKKK